MECRYWCSGLRKDREVKGGILSIKYVCLNVSMCVLPIPGVVSAEKMTTDNKSPLTTGDFSKKTFKEVDF